MAFGSQNGGRNEIVRTLEQARAELRGQLADCEHRLAALDAALAVFEPGGASNRSPRAVGAAPRGQPRKGTLKEHILAALQGRGVMSVAEVTAAVLQAGFKTKNKTLDKSVGITLATMPEVKKVSRGHFQLG